MKIKTKNFLIALVLLIATATNFKAQAASPEIPSGVFNSINKIEVLTQKRYEHVNINAEQGKARRLELATSGWICTNQTSIIVKCSIFSKEKILPGSLTQSLNEEFSSLQVAFSFENSINLINKAESLIEYEITQNVRLQLQKPHIVDKNYSKYILRFIKNGPTKIVLGSSQPAQDPDGQFEFLFENGIDNTNSSDDSISIVRSINLNETQTTSSLFLVKITFNRN